jgi:hypothetical protein
MPDIGRPAFLKYCRWQLVHSPRSGIDAKNYMKKNNSLWFLNAAVKR